MNLIDMVPVKTFIVLQRTQPRANNGMCDLTGRKGGSTCCGDPEEVTLAGVKKYPKEVASR